MDKLERADTMEHDFDDFEIITKQMPHNQHRSRIWMLPKRWWTFGELFRLEVYVN